MILEVKLYFEDLEANGASVATLKNYKAWMERFLETLAIETSYQLKEIKKEDIQRYRLSLKSDGLSDATLNAYVAPVVNMFKFLYEEGYIEKNPSRGIRPTKIPQKPMIYLTEEEAKVLVKACKNKRQKALFYLMITTGIRVSEAMDLTMEDVKDSKIFIRKAKRGETRYIPINTTATRYIKDYIGRTEITTIVGKSCLDKNGDVVYKDGERVPAVVPHIAKENYLFTTNNGGQMTATSINKELKATAKRAGITKNISCHKLRSTAATLQSIHGTNMKNIQTMLGHQSQQMTARYVQMVDSNYQDEVMNNGLWDEDEDDYDGE